MLAAVSDPGSARMARIGRFVVPGLPHHVTQRGNRRERVFFGDEDYELYRDLLASQCRKQGVAVLGLLPDAQPRPSHPRPRREEASGRALGETHRRYSSVVNARAPGDRAISSSRALARS